MVALDNVIKRIERLIIQLALFVMVVVTFAQVVARFVFMSPLSWSEEMGRFLFVWITFFGASYALSFNKHFCVDFLLSALSPAMKKHFETAISVVILSFCAIMVYYGTVVTKFTILQVSPAMLLPMTYPYLCIPISGIFMIIHTITHMVSRDRPVSEGAAAE